MIAGGIAIKESGKFPFGAGSESPVAAAPTSTPTPISERAARKTAIADAEKRAAEAEERAADNAAIRAAEERIKKAQEAPKISPTPTLTDAEKSERTVDEAFGRRKAELQDKYDKAHPTPVIPTAVPASRGKPGQGSEGEGAPLGGLLFGSAITAAVLGAMYRFRAQGGRLITAIRNRFGHHAPPVA